VWEGAHIALIARDDGVFHLMAFLILSIAAIFTVVGGQEPLPQTTESWLIGLFSANL
jgi:hypothetical protein